MNNNLILHPKYQPLWTSDSNIFVITGGRASAKSFHVATFLVDLMCRNEEHVILYTRYTMSSASISIIPEFKDKIDRLVLYDVFRTNTADIENTQTNSKILFRGIKTSSGNQTAKLKSIEGLTTFVIDEAEEFVDEESFETILYSIRKKGVSNRVIIVLNPCYKNHWIYRRFFKIPNVNFDYNGEKNGVCYIHTSYLDNIKNLNRSFSNHAHKVKFANIEKYNHLFLGHWTDGSTNALWKMGIMIDPYRVNEHPELKRIVIAIDPSVSSTGRQDECGIGAAGIGFDNHYYILSDISGMFSPAEWGRVAVGEYKNKHADNIIAESNQGGDLVKMNIKNIDNTVPVKLVRATRGKILRAEPIAALYEDGKVHHVGNFPHLELEMTTYTGSTNEASPNRLDWLVWALTDLSQNNSRIGIRSL